MNDIIAINAGEQNGDLGSGRNRLSAARVPTSKVFEPGSAIARNTENRSHAYDSFFKSITDYRSEQKAKFNATASYGEFSGEFHSSFERNFTSHQERIAALRTFHCEVGKAWLDDASKATLTESFTAGCASLPQAFSPADAYKFYEFFDQFGTDTVISITLGGAFYFQSLVEKSKISELEKIKVSIQAEYGAFFTADGSFSQTTEEKKYRESRIAEVTTEGGAYNKFANINFNTETKYNQKFDDWVNSVKDNPVIVSRALWPIYVFVPDKSRQKAAQDALEKYLDRTLTVSANWQFSSLTTGSTLRPQTLVAQASTNPGIRVKILSRKTLVGEERYFQAPDIGAGQAQIEQYWANFKATLQGAGLKDSIVMLATQRWPRESRYCPSEEVFSFLRHECGASEATLRRWREDSSHCLPCPYAGITYGLIGYGGGALPDQGGDAYAIGFGNPDESTQDLRLGPEVEISADLAGTGHESSRFNCNDIFAELASALAAVRSDHWNTWLMGVDPQDSTRMMMLDQGSAPSPSSLWYLHPHGAKYGMNPFYYINARTCGFMQWNTEGADVQAEAVLRPYRPNLDINLWDKRLPYIMCLSYNPNWDLRAREDRRVTVAEYRKDTEMKWSQEAVNIVL